MKVIPFPGGDSASPDETWLAELEAALNGDGKGASADSWRELRADIRALAPPMDPEFERQLRARIVERGTHPQGARTALNPAPKQSRRRLAWLRPLGRPAVAAIATGLTVLAVVIAIAGSSLNGPSREAVPAPAVSNAGRAEASTPGASASGGAAKATTRQGDLEPATSGPAASGPAASSAPASTPASAPAVGGAGSAPGRVQQLGASITLTATPNDVQETADRVSRLVVSDGGFVQSSQVNVGQGTGEANLTLSLPSAKLSGALASLGQLAPVRAESQSLQDITNTYNAAHQRVADATAERRALLRALSQASTEGQIDSLRERLSQNRGAITQAHSALQAVSRHASTAEVEVTVVGDAHAGSEGLTLHRGLHDAGRVLVVTLVVLLIAAAILVPLALLLLALLTARRAWLRHRRERVLDAP
jgi:Domain of unknown function (DUF4349)